MMNSNTLDTDSTSRAKKFLPFWDKSCQEISRQLWSSIALTYSRPGVDRSILSSGSVNSKIANSWFCAEQTYLPNQKWLKISYESSRLTIADSTPSVKTNLLSKKIRVYPETKLAQKWRTWIAASRWCYNQAIAILKNEKIGKYELRKRIMDSAPEWVSQQPYNPRQLAVFQACEHTKQLVNPKVQPNLEVVKLLLKLLGFKQQTGNQILSIRAKPKACLLKRLKQ